MRPKSPAEDRDEDLFRSRPANMLDPRHELLRLAALIDWAAPDAAFGPLYAEAGRPGLPTRLMAGLHLLKHAKGLSDEQVCAQWIENPYFQASCGEAWFRHRLPLDRSSMTRWRRRIGPERVEALLAETIAAAVRSGAMEERRAKRVTIDTTVQCQGGGAPDRQPSAPPRRPAAEPPGPPARGGAAAPVLRAAGRPRPARGGAADARAGSPAGAAPRPPPARLPRPAAPRRRPQTRRPAGPRGRLRHRPGARRPSPRAEASSRRSLLAQKPGDTGKLYALHAPEVECIGKGKARVRYEFGVKLGVAVSNARAPGGQFVLGVRALPGNPYDGHTLAAQIAQAERLTGERAERAYVDQGYRGHDADRARVFITRQRRHGLTPTIRRELRRRSAVEPVIGPLKSDGLLERNHLAGAAGDAINAVLAAAGHNLRLLLAWLRPLCAWILAALRSHLRRRDVRVTAAVPPTAPQHAIG